MPKVSRRNKRRNSPISRKRILLGVCSLLLVVGFGFWYFLHQRAELSGTWSEPVKLAKAGLSEDRPVHRNPIDTEANVPIALHIEKIGVIDAPIVPVGLEADGAMGAPSNIHEVGWYIGSALPGSGSGALLMDGHISGVGSRPGVFYHLDRLRVGDVVSVTAADQTTVRYEVREVEVLPVPEVDMVKAMRSIDSKKEGLNLISCIGTYDYNQQQYEDRIIVYAVRIDD